MTSPPAAAQKTGGLWKHADFLKLWAGQTISELGSHITRDGLPLLAVITMGATSTEMGLLSAIGDAPVIVVGLVAGVWVDRLRRRPLMIAADLGRALLLGTIPLMAVLGVLRMGWLYLVVALTGILTVLFTVAYRSYLPSLVEREHIVEGNSKLALSDSTAEIVGPGITGVLVQTITAPIAILFDALSFVASALSVGAIRKTEPALPLVENRQSMWKEAKEGLQVVFRSPVLLAFAGQAATSSFFGSFFGVLYGLYAIRVLNMQPAVLGLIIAVGGVGSLIGALIAPRVVRRLGLGMTLIGALLFAGLVDFLIPLAGSFPAYAAVFMIVSQLGDIFHTVFAINEISLRQSITPDRLLGRTNASIELLSTGVGPLGALAGGVLGDQIGIQNTLFIAAGGILFSSLWVILSPVRHIRGIPETND